MTPGTNVATTHNNSPTTNAPKRSLEGLDERTLKRLEEWRADEKVLPEGVTKNGLKKVLGHLRHMNLPATFEEKAVFAKKVVDFAEAFQIPTMETEAATAHYASALRDIPGDILILAFDRIEREWFANRLPPPAKVRKMVSEEISTRLLAIAKVENAIKLGTERAPARQPKGDDVNLKAEYERLGIDWPGYEKASWLEVINLG